MLFCEIDDNRLFRNVNSQDLVPEIIHIYKKQNYEPYLDRFQRLIANFCFI